MELLYGDKQIINNIDARWTESQIDTETDNGIAIYNQSIYPLH